MDNNLPIKFSWGTFCRRAVIDEQTKEISAIDITPALRVELVQFQLDANNARIPISLGRIYAIALFERVDNSNNEINESINIEVVQTGFNSLPIEGKITIKSTESSEFVNLNLENLVLNISSEKSSNNYSFEVIYKLHNQELGKIVLPVKVELKSLEDK